MNKLRNGKWNHQMATAEEVKETVNEIKTLVVKYHWEDKKMFDPYGHCTTVGKFLSNGFEDFEQYTFSSKQILISELNGFIEHCINSWEKLENEPKVTVKLTNGNVKSVPKSTVDDYIELGIATLVEEDKQ